ncbi:MAG: hypothetical protein KC643_10460, partial [Nitrospira sp.]|nr:hypothetical protein [Nitrospira sp.]
MSGIEENWLTGKSGKLEFPLPPLSFLFGMKPPYKGGEGKRMYWGRIKQVLEGIIFYGWSPRMLAAFWRAL